MNPAFLITYISPNRSTAAVAAALAQQLDSRGAQTTLFDLAKGNRTDLETALSGATPPCLCIGSPVYRDGAVPPIIDFIHSLPATSGGWAVPFITWGTACSGVALWQMAGALAEKGYQIAGAAKVAALHSMAWSDNPPGEGRPSADDLSQVSELADSLYDRLAAGVVAPLAREALDYQPAALAAESKVKVEQPWKTIPKTVDTETCTSCGTCVEVCPVQAITLDPQPIFGDACFDCFNCVRNCPEEAIEPEIPIATIEAMLRKRIAAIDEMPHTRIFLGEPG